MTKTVYQCDVNGIYIGAETSQSSPLEIGVWLIPAGCVEVPPPPTTITQYAQFINGAWEVKDIPTPPAAEPEPELTPEQIQAQADEVLIAAEIRRMAIANLGDKLSVTKQ